MDNKAKIRINLNLREFEIEGSEDFVNSHAAKIESFLTILKNSPPPVIHDTVNPPKDTSEKRIAKKSSEHKQTNDGIPDSFGEYYHGLKKGAKEADKILLAGHFIQSKSEDNLFSTKEAATALLDQGVKLSNPTVFVNRNEVSKHIIKISKGKFRVSKTGLEHIAGLLSADKEK
ncbi:MAG: hypothetical protein GC205_10935 [Bacteroidetes bacterium]|nr:hypothetical protein [Bacteroidota bacterium]